MIARDICQRVLQQAVFTGADYAELFAEHSDERAITMLPELVDKLAALLKKEKPEAQAPAEDGPDAP